MDLPVPFGELLFQSLGKKKIIDQSSWYILEESSAEILKIIKSFVKQYCNETCSEACETCILKLNSPNIC